MHNSYAKINNYLNYNFKLDIIYEMAVCTYNIFCRVLFVNLLSILLVVILSKLTRAAKYFLAQIYIIIA